VLRGEKLFSQGENSKMDNDMEEMNDYSRLSVMENNINNNSLDSKGLRQSEWK
jgi:hypothetical protein